MGDGREFCCDDDCCCGCCDSGGEIVVGVAPFVMLWIEGRVCRSAIELRSQLTIMFICWLAWYQFFRLDDRVIQEYFGDI